MKATDTGGADFEQAPLGNHVARCVRVIDLGTRKKEYQGQTELKHEIVIGWELPHELMTTGDHAGKPFTVSKFYRLSLSEKANLRSDLKNWRGRDFTPEELAGFPIKNILDKGCQVSVIANKRGKSEVSVVMGLTKGTVVPPRVNDLQYFSLDEDEFSKESFEKVSKGFQKMIAESPEYKLLTGQMAAHEAQRPAQQRPAQQQPAQQQPAPAMQQNVGAQQPAGGNAMPLEAFDDDIPF